MFKQLLGLDVSASQNEILDILATQTLQEKLKTTREPKFFSIIADEGTDVGNKEQRFVFEL